MGVSGRRRVGCVGSALGVVVIFVLFLHLAHTAFHAFEFLFEGCDGTPQFGLFLVGGDLEAFEQALTGFFEVLFDLEDLADGTHHRGPKGAIENFLYGGHTDLESLVE